MQEITAKGVDGTIAFDGRTVTIRREGLGARTQHRGGGDVTVPIEQVAAVEFKGVALLTGGNRNWHGRITVVVAGAPPRSDARRGARMVDPFTVEFARRAGDFEAVRDAINAALAGPRQAAPAGPGPGGGASSLAGQLGELARLHEAGALSDTEFAAAKARLLGT